MPVLPLVGSTTFIPGLSLPVFSASQIIEAPMRHLTLYAGLRPSILARTVAPSPLAKRLILMRGVRPMESALSLKIGIVLGSFRKESKAGKRRRHNRYFNER